MKRFRDWEDEDLNMIPWWVILTPVVVMVLLLVWGLLNSLLCSYGQIGATTLVGTDWGCFLR